MPKLQESKDKYHLSIPKAMVVRKGWVKGTNLFFTWNERGNIEIHE